jgi:hypothetical protein
MKASWKNLEGRMMFQKIAIVDHAFEIMILLFSSLVTDLLKVELFCLKVEDMK